VSFCKNCGKQIPDDYRFCPFCKAPQYLQSGGNPPPQYYPSPQQQQQTVVVQREGHFWRYVILIIVIVVVLFLCYIVGAAGQTCDSSGAVLGIAATATIYRLLRRL
jgi:uncharacterized membrane protein YvbJ